MYRVPQQSEVEVELVVEAPRGIRRRDELAVAEARVERARGQQHGALAEPDARAQGMVQEVCGAAGPPR